MDDTSVRFTVKLERRVYEQIKRDAEREHRTIRGQLQTILEEAYNTNNK